VVCDPPIVVLVGKLKPFVDILARNGSLLTLGLKPDQGAKTFIISASSELGRLFKWCEEYKSAKAHPSDESMDVEIHGHKEQDGTNTAEGLEADLAILNSRAQDTKKRLQVIALTPGRNVRTVSEFTFVTGEADINSLSKWINRSAMRLSCVCSVNACLLR
jgi:hypothetical protein